MAARPDAWQESFERLLEAWNDLEDLLARGVAGSEIAVARARLDIARQVLRSTPRTRQEGPIRARG